MFIYFLDKMIPLSQNFLRVDNYKVSVLLFFCSRKVKRLIISCGKNVLLSNEPILILLSFRVYREIQSLYLVINKEILSSFLVIKVKRLIIPSGKNVLLSNESTLIFLSFRAYREIQSLYLIFNKEILSSF